MAESAPRTAIPAHFVTLDAAAYAAGTSDSAWLGAQLAQRDRWLAGHLRRGFSEAWPQNQEGSGLSNVRLPVIDSLSRTILGPYPCIPTPLTQGCEFYLAAKISEGWTVHLTPFAYPSHPYRYDAEDAYEAVGTGAVETYGPIFIDLRGVGEYCEIGLVLTPQVLPGTVTTGDVRQAWLYSIVSTGPDFAGLTRPYNRAIQILDDSEAITPWLPVTAIGDSINDKDTIITYPTLVGVSLNIDDHMRWQMRTLGDIELYSIAFFELPLTGRL